MNTWQVARQIKALLQAAEWPDGTTDPVFGQVVVSAQDPVEATARGRLPAAVVRVGKATADPDESDILVQELEVVVVARVAADGHGEAALIGGARSGGQGSSSGRGVLELEEEVLRAVRWLNESSGVRLLVTHAGAAEPKSVEKIGSVVVKAIVLRVWTTKNRSYPKPTRLAATAAGGGVVNIAWSLPAARFDRLEVRLRRAAGSTAPASPSAGDAVALASALATSKADSPGAGTFSYALFAGYDETGAGSTDRWSSAATATVVAT